jgi:hypothetical protein
VEAHGGNIDATSGGEGKGSIFTVFLPIRAVRIREATEEEEITRDSGQDEPTDSGHVADRPPVRLDGLQVLVVDDEPDARRVLALVLERVGAVVATADSARAAIEALPSPEGRCTVGALGWVSGSSIRFDRHTSPAR